ncbi:hypothetical protein A2U01_0049667, partial [Trifolium medium]|nr:hypothetical protein [Trifolium medium]
MSSMRICFPTNFTPPHHQLGRLFITMTDNAPAEYAVVGDATEKYAAVGDIAA